MDFYKYDFLNDITVSVQFKYLDKKFPNSKFIYTIRDEDSWLKSCKLQFGIRRNKRESYYLRISTYGFPYITDDFCYDLLLEKYRSHHKDVMNYFKFRPQDILVMDICNGDGWDSLCRFLDVDKPDSLFPRKNIRTKK